MCCRDCKSHAISITATDVDLVGLDRILRDYSQRNNSLEHRQHHLLLIFQRLTTDCLLLAEMRFLLRLDPRPGHSSSSALDSIHVMSIPSFFLEALQAAVTFLLISALPPLHHTIPNKAPHSQTSLGSPDRLGVENVVNVSTLTSGNTRTLTIVAVGSRTDKVAWESGFEWFDICSVERG